jgi:hypothetical protein
MPWQELGGANANLGGNSINPAIHWLGTRNAAPLIIRTENGALGNNNAPNPAAEVMRITAAAQGRRVGIGTTQPLYKLHITSPGGFGPEDANGISQAGDVPIVAQSNSTAFGVINADGRQAFALNIDAIGGTNNARGVPTFYDKFDGSWHPSLSLRNGNVGIGTTTPAIGAKLHLNGSGGNFALTFTNTSHLAGQQGARIAFDNGRLTFQRVDDSGAFSATSVNQMAIMQATGNVGIGTIEPMTATGGRVLHIDNPGGASVLRLGNGAPNGQQWEWQSTVIGNMGVMNLSNLTNNTNPFTVQANGTILKPGGGFRIDHPLDPENKYLYHSFVESSDMMNVYNGNVTTDASGNVTVVLPDYFEALNQDFRYQLTVIGQPAQAIVEEEVKNNQFTIKTDKPNVKVSWQITGVRKDPFANAHRIPVEEYKPADKRKMYLHSEEPVSKIVGIA